MTTTPLQICPKNGDPSHPDLSPHTDHNLSEPTPDFIGEFQKFMAAAPPNGSAAATSLETQRLNAHLLLSHPSAYERYRHEGAHNDRRAIAFALQRTSTSAKVVAKFCTCGSNATVWRHRHLKHEFRIRSQKCGHRFCPACAAETGWVIQKTLTELGEKAGQNLSLITLTLRHCKTGLAGLLARLVTGFRELRRTVVWRSAVTAGAWILEVKRGADGDWHPHVHILAHAKYIKPGLLQAAWLTCTGDSSIVDVRRRTPFAGARYVAKYITKPAHHSIIANPVDLDEFITATRRLRRCATFGAWRGTKLTDLYLEELWSEANDPSDPENWEQVGYLSDIVDLMSKGNEEATLIWKALKLKPKGHSP